MTEPIKVSALAILRAAAAGRADKTLAAFNPGLLAERKGTRRPTCRYRYPNHPGVACAVGKGLPDSFANAMNDHENSQTVHALNGVNFGSREDRSMLRELQERHDAAVTSAPGDDRKKKRATFNRYLDSNLARLEAAA